MKANVQIFTLWMAFHGSMAQLPDGFVYLDEVDSSIIVDLRYHSESNFMGRRINGYYADRCIVTKSAALALRNVQSELKIQGLGLKIFDAYRPQTAVDHFVSWTANPIDTLNKREYYPRIAKNSLIEKGYIAAKSGHSRGSTVDLTLVYLKGQKATQELDMGTGWDYFSLESWPSSDQVSISQKENRLLLREVMINHGFKPLREEWWHFTLEKEPFPNTYFDFPIR